MFKDLTIEDFKNFHPEFHQDIYDNLNPMNVVRSRKSLGGTGFDQIEIELTHWKKKLLI